MHFGSEPLRSSYKEIYSRLADFFLLLSNSITWQILYSFRKKGMTLSEISKNLKMTQKAVLPELRVLQNKDILVCFNKSHRTYYRLADDRILQAFDLLHGICQRKAKKAQTKSPARKTSRITQMRRA
jgi:DNA-binding transcriptional regulator GbsR (MarR family)